MTASKPAWPKAFYHCGFTCPEVTIGMALPNDALPFLSLFGGRKPVPKQSSVVATVNLLGGRSPSGTHLRLKKDGHTTNSSRYHLA